MFHLLFMSSVRSLQGGQPIQSGARVKKPVFFMDNWSCNSTLFPIIPVLLYNLHTLQLQADRYIAWIFS